MTDPVFLGTPSGAPPQYTFVVPYARVSPIHIPRRDLVLGATDSLSLRVKIVENDTPAAQPLLLTTGIGTPACRLVIWRDGPHHSWDYDAPEPQIGEVLWSGVGVLADQVAAPGCFDIAMPQATMASWPRRCGFWLFFDWTGALSSELLAQGGLHVARAAGAPTVTGVPITTDTLVPITTD